MKVTYDLNGLHIWNDKQQIIQTLQSPRPTTDEPRTQFGSKILLALPYLFVTEGWLRSGTIWVYRWYQRQFRLLHQIDSPSDLHGFGKAMVFEAPFLFISHVTDNNYRGSLWWANIEQRDLSLTCFYRHEPEKECIGTAIQVQKIAPRQFEVQAFGFDRERLHMIDVTLVLKRDTEQRGMPLTIASADVKRVHDVSLRVEVAY